MKWSHAQWPLWLLMTDLVCHSWRVHLCCHPGDWGDPLHTCQATRNHSADCKSPTKSMEVSQLYPTIWRKSWIRIHEAGRCRTTCSRGRTAEDWLYIEHRAGFGTTTSWARILLSTIFSTEFFLIAYHLNELSILYSVDIFAETLQICWSCHFH